MLAEPPRGHGTPEAGMAYDVFRLDAAPRVTAASAASHYANQAVRIPAPLELGCPDSPGWYPWILLLAVRKSTWHDTRCSTVCLYASVFYAQSALVSKANACRACKSPHRMPHVTLAPVCTALHAPKKREQIYFSFFFNSFMRLRESLADKWRFRVNY